MRIDRWCPADRIAGRARGVARAALLALLLPLALPSAARALSYTWTGGGGADTNWSNGANWGGAGPASGEISVSLSFPALSGHYASHNDLTDVHVTFLSVATQLSDGDYSFTGNPIRLEGPSTLASPGSGTPNLVWEIPLTLDANATIAASGRQTQLRGDIDLGTRNLTFNAGGDIVITGVISGSGNIIKNNTAALTIRSSNTYTGTTTSNNGALYIADPGSLGTAAGGTTITGGFLGFVPSSSFILAEPLLFSGGGILAYGTPAISGPFTANAAIDVMAFDPPAVLTIASAIGGSGGLAIGGDGRVVLAGAETYTGDTAVETGTLQLDGSLASTADVTVKSGATLKGNGSAAGAINVESGGTLAPGASPGSLASGGLTMVSGATLVAEINGPTAVTQYDRLSVSGPVSLGGATLSIVLGYEPAAGQAFTVIAQQQGQAVSGTFDGLAEGATFAVAAKTFGITYRGGAGRDVVVIAEPGSDTPTPGSETPTPTATPISGACTGDCNGDGSVGINELITGVNIALATASTTSCPAFDVNQDGMVTIQELIAAVNNALGGCH